MRRFAPFLLALAACSGEELGEARFAAEQCRAVELVDAETGATVVGAEDISFDFARELLYVSAYDRLSEDPGGVYALPLADLRALDIISASSVVPWERPHGIHVGPGKIRLLIREDDGTFLTEASNGRETVDGIPKDIRRWETPVKIHCAANDVSPQPDDTIWFDTLVTSDSATCDRTFLSSALEGETGFVERLTLAAGPEWSKDYDRTLVRDGLQLPNGIAPWYQDVWIAEMRGRRMTELESGRTIDLPGAPDNLNSSGEGIVAALQPQLWRFGLYRYGHTDRAPTRIALIDPKTEEIEILYDDPKGTLLSGATAAVLIDDSTMIASSVRGDRLLVCEPEG